MLCLWVVVCLCIICVSACVLSVVYFIVCDARYAIGVASPENLLKEIYLRRTGFYDIDQEGEFQGRITEPGKLPLTCIYATIFKIATHQKFSGKKIKPCQLCVTRYFATTHNE